MSTVFIEGAPQPHGVQQDTFDFEVSFAEYGIKAGLECKYKIRVCAFVAGGTSSLGYRSKYIFINEMVCPK